MSDSVDIRIQDKQLTLSNPDKVLYPATGFTKAAVIDYYVRIAPYLLPHLRGRALTLKRYPHGVTGEFFYEKRCPLHRPKWLPVAKKGRTDRPEYCVVNDIAGLVWIANLASIELHPLLSREDQSLPTMMVFDLDPGPGRSVLDCAWIGLELRRLLKEFKLECFPKTSGGKGLHLSVPINTPTDYEATKGLSYNLALEMDRRLPGHTTANMRKTLRQGKIFIDWSQNSEHKTTVCAYSLRAREKPCVSTPVTWKEVEVALKKKDIGALSFSPEDVLKRVKKYGDLYAEVVTLKQKLPKF
jgi:bifunctional non-homologous end joining protein LigD